MGNYVGPETMFMLSLKPDQREFLSDTIEEAVSMRAEGLNTSEIEQRLSEAIAIVESWSSTPRIVKRLVLGTYDSSAA